MCRRTHARHRFAWHTAGAWTREDIGKPDRPFRSEQLATTRIRDLEKIRGASAGAAPAADEAPKASKAPRKKEPSEDKVTVTKKTAAKAGKAAVRQGGGAAGKGVSVATKVEKAARKEAKSAKSNTSTLSKGAYAKVVVAHMSPFPSCTPTGGLSFLYPFCTDGVCLQITPTLGTHCTRRAMVGWVCQTQTRRGGDMMG